MVMLAVGVIGIPMVLSLILTKLIINAAPVVGLVDQPGVRKVHSQPIPLGGGVAIYLSLAATMMLVVAAAWIIVHLPWIHRWIPPDIVRHAPGILYRAGLLALLVGVAGAQMFVGLADDWRIGGINYRLRLLLEVAFVFLLMTQGVRLSLFLSLPLVAMALTVLWIVGLTNAFNFLDNMDGLSAGVALITSAIFTGIALLVGNNFVAGGFAVLIGALLGFLHFNWNPARIFMGDAGSNFIGFWISVLTIAGTYTGNGHDHVTLFAPLCVLAVPIYDSLTVVTLRIIQGKSPFQADKQHFSHRLVTLGLRPTQAVLLIYLVTFTTGLSGVLLYALPASATPLALAQVVCILGVIALLEIAAHRRPGRPS